MPDEEIVADYKLTRDFVPIDSAEMERVKAIVKMAGMDNIDDEHARMVCASDPEAAHLTLAMIRRKYGSMALYLSQGLEFREHEIQALQKALTTPLQRPSATSILSPIQTGNQFVFAVAVAGLLYILWQRRRQCAL